MNEGKLIVVEAVCDGVGKSTQVDLLTKRLESEGRDIVFHHFPSYGTYHGKIVEEYLKGTFGNPEENSPYFVNSLYAIDRAIKWHSCLKELYSKGKIILCDRYTTSSLSYQSAFIENLEEKKKFIEYVSDFEYNKLGIKKPDIVIFLNVSFDTSNKMRNLRVDNEGIINDVHERNINFLRHAYDSSLFVAEYLSWDFINCEIDGSLRSREDIHEEIYSLVKKL